MGEPAALGAIALAFLVVAASPGPANLACASVAMARGRRDGLRIAAGLAIGLALWGGLVVSQIDNVLRPLLISSATQIPYLLVLFGVLGGLLAFGLVGLFLGPVVIAVLLAVWREWLQEQSVV